jgi:hypothetical protein
VLPIFDEQLAKHLGLDALRVGAGRTNSITGPRVLVWWSVNVEPSFAPSWVVGALHEEEWSGGPDPERITIRGFVADAAGAAIAPLDADEVLGELGRLNPFQVAPTHREKAFGFGKEMWCEMGSLDGLGYLLRWGTRATEGQFRFANPHVGWLDEFERVLFRFASRVITASGVGRFEEQLECWADYRESVVSAEPGAAPDPAT